MRGFAEAAGAFLRTLDAPLERLVPRPDPAARFIEAANADAHSDADLLRLLLTSARRGNDPGDAPARALEQFGSFARVLAASPRELEAVPGLGEHSIAALRLLHEAAVRLGREGLARRRLVDDPRDLYGYLSAVLGRERIEQFRILFLDADDALIRDEAQARGTVNHTPVYPREVVRRALELDAAALILVHNHPSGDPTPSDDDLAMTRQIAEAVGTMDIVVRDHVIVGNGRYFSFRREGLLG